MYVGEQDHWLFDQQLTESYDLIPIDVTVIPAPKLYDHDKVNVSPTEVKIESSTSPSAENIVKLEENIILLEPERVGVVSKDESEFASTNFHDCLGKDKLTDDINLMDGLTEFIPWTGFDYTSDGDFDEDDVEEITDKAGGTKKKRKRTNQKQPSCDADLIASATEENLRKLGIDPLSNEGKKARRKIRNRLSAQLHRERKKGYISYLEELVKERDRRLLSASKFMQNLHRENFNLRSKFGLKRSILSNGDVDYSSTASAAGNTDSDTGEDSDTASVSSETYKQNLAIPHLPKRLLSIGTRFKGSKVGSAISLISAVLMISITIFGPHIQNDYTLSVSAPSVIGDHSSSFAPALVVDERDSIMTTSDNSIVFGDSNKQLTASQHGRSLQSVSSAFLSQNLNDFIAQSSGSANWQQSPDSGKSLVSVSLPITNRFVSANINSNPKELNSVSLSSTHGLWHYRDHITDLYPPLIRYYNPNEEVAANYTVNMRVRRNLRTRDDRNFTHSVHRPAIKSEGVQLHVQRRIKAAGQEAEDSADFDDGVHDIDMGKTLVSIFPKQITGQSQSPAISSSHSQPSLDYSTTAAPSGPSKSMSRILLTQGRALLDPSLIDSPVIDQKGNVVPLGGKGEAGANSFMGSLSTWTSAGERSNIEPPVVRVGINSMGATSDPSRDMLVMLLPASSVRWGKNWGESSEGTMEAMLKGLNFTDSTYSSYGNNLNSDGTANDNEEGMWVEIGCNVFRAQLVRNVTLSS